MLSENSVPRNRGSRTSAFTKRLFVEAPASAPALRPVPKTLRSRKPTRPRSCS